MAASSAHRTWITTRMNHPITTRGFWWLSLQWSARNFHFQVDRPQTVHTQTVRLPLVNSGSTVAATNYLKQFPYSVMVCNSIFAYIQPLCCHFHGGVHFQKVSQPAFLGVLIIFGSVPHPIPLSHVCQKLVAYIWKTKGNLLQHPWHHHQHFSLQNQIHLQNRVAHTVNLYKYSIYYTLLAETQ